MTDIEMRRGEMRRGTLVLVVGPSGVGKDSLIGGARQALAGDPRFAFPRRWITRAEDAGGEDHIAVTAEAFAARRESGGFLLSWYAHGLEYGIPIEIADRLARGITVIVNVSRGVIDAARRVAPPTLVISVTAPPAILARRLAARGRERVEEVAVRLARNVPAPLAGHDVVTVENDGALEQAVARFLAVLRASG